MKALLIAAALAAPARAGLEQAAGAASAAFRQALAAPVLKLVPALGPAASSWDEGSLLALLADADPAVRAAAAKALRVHAASWRVESALRARAEDERELEPVRRAALKSLSAVAHGWNTRRAIQALADDERETLSLRALALKCLYPAAVEPDIRRELQRRLEDRSEKAELRAAAAWTLWGTAPAEAWVRRALIGAALDGGAPETLRLESVRSLYLSLGQWEARDALLSLSRESRQPAALRAAATLTLHGASQEWLVRRYLEELAQSGASAPLRAAAIQALQPGLTLEQARFFHLSAYQGRFLDPLENE